jgi:hypothetical protein
MGDNEKNCAHCTGTGCSHIDILTERVGKMEGDLAPLLQQALAELRAIREQNQTQLEIMTAWNNAKGFVHTVRFLGRLLKWVGGITGAVIGLYALFKHGVSGNGG